MVGWVALVVGLVVYGAAMFALGWDHRLRRSGPGGNWWDNPGWGEGWPTDPLPTPPDGVRAGLTPVWDRLPHVSGLGRG